MTRQNVLNGILLAIVGLSLPAVVNAQKLVFVVRHAERADGGMSKMQAQKDPGLSATGRKRALKLAAMLRDAGIRAIYATEFRRTQETAKPLATRLGLPIRGLSSNDTGALVAELRSRNANDIVLVVGHSNTVPDVIKALCGAEVSIADDEYDNLFIVVPADKTLTRIRFTP